MSLEHPHTPLEEAPSGEEAPVHLWKPFHINVDEHYHFIPRRKLSRLLSYAVKMAAVGLFFCYNRLFYGFRVRGRENFKGIQGGAVTVCNHVQGLDCSFVVQAIAPKNLYYPTVKTNLELAGLRWLIRACGGLPIPETPKALRVFNGVIQELLSRGNYVHVYPEGILYPYYLKGIRKFHRGAFKYAYDGCVPIVPMVITFRKRRGLRKLLNRKPLPTLTVLEPIYPDVSRKAKAEINDMMFRCYEMMSDYFDEHSIPYREEYPQEEKGAVRTQQRDEYEPAATRN